ncbi:hypothetical protein DPMN_005018 [Dreissena polymorpha]|uniref:Uncharacterized protein n=1 Tax=Dreissena polymorpha TaxID=45954 RepID=A0A9D4MSN8_DREPO|nr:hypothetical protein DPMN_005018 [Dreissena polymorpha]
MVDDGFNVKAGVVAVADILVKDAMKSAEEVVRGLVGRFVLLVDDEVVVTDIVAAGLLIVVTVVCDVLAGLLEANVTVCDVVIGLLTDEVIVCEDVSVDMHVDDVVVCVMLDKFVEDTIVDFVVVVTSFWVKIVFVLFSLKHRNTYI